MLSKISVWTWSFASLIGLSISNVELVRAQVTADETLGTQINQQGNLAEINGGTQAGSNLFHSFQEFSLETGATASFNNGADISNIFSRVTGESASNINGLIRANGNANLILLNPRGINFGANATLDIGGSFLGSTANSLIFGDGTVFSSIDAQLNPLLTISAPIGLQLGEDASSITVAGEGHDLSVENPVFSTFDIGEVTGLKVVPGQTIALVGGDLNINGGDLTANEGHIELGSVETGLVNINSVAQGWNFSYENIATFQDISLEQKAIADTSGVNGGSIHIQGRQVILNDGSTVLIQNQGEQASGDLVVNAADNLQINEGTIDGELSSGLFTEALGDGKGGDLEISTSKLTLQEGGVIISNTSGQAEAGQIIVTASEAVLIDGFLEVNPNRFSILSSQTFGIGDAGDVDVSTQKLTALNGGNVASLAGGVTNTGSAGQVNINAMESIELDGVILETFIPSQISAGTGSAGNAGNVNIQTQQLTIKNGGRVDASTTATGNAGNVNINATDFINVNGTVVGSFNPSLITSSANILDPSLQELLGLPPIPSGNAGNIQIETSELILADGALITSTNQGLGNSGKVQIDANSIFLSSNSGITSEIGSTSNTFANNDGSFLEQIEFGEDPNQALSNVNTPGGDIKISTQVLSLDSGATISTDTLTGLKGGDIIIDAEESIELQGSSVLNPNAVTSISTSSFGTGNAGNLNLSTGKLTILDGSRIGAGTFGIASGGDITVRAESIEVIGSNLTQSTASLLGASSLGAGNAGNLTINTTELVIQDGGRVDSAAAATGSAGNVDIEATESIEVSGFIPATSEFSFISSGVNVESETAQQIFQLPDVPSGNAGNVNIITGSLNVTDQANVSVVNEGSGDAGTLEITANSILLNNEGFLSAATQTGIGGNISLVTDTFFLQNNSATTATAGASGTGGNIVVESNNIGILGESQIIADAFMGMGGNILINTEVFLSCGECQITASSILGIDGQVVIETLQPNARLDIVDIPLKLIQAKENVAISCQAQEQNSSSELTISGRGGLPPRPQDLLTGESLVNLNDFSNSPESSNSSSPNKKSLLPPPAQSWYQDSQGTVVLSARLIKPTKNNKLFYDANCHMN